MRKYIQEQILENYGEDSLKEIERYLAEQEPCNNLLIYVDDIVFKIIGGILTNHSMSVDNALELLDIDMDTWASAQDWDDWDYEALQLVNVE